MFVRCGEELWGKVVAVTTFLFAKEKEGMFDHEGLPNSSIFNYMRMRVGGNWGIEYNAALQLSQLQPMQY